MTASVTHPDVHRLLGAGRLALEFDMPSWYKLKRFAPDGRGDVYMVAERMPLMVAFKHGRGQVVFTSFHNRAQPGEVVGKLLRFLVLVPVVRSATVAVHAVELADGNLRRYRQLESVAGGDQRW